MTPLWSIEMLTVMIAVVCCAAPMSAAESGVCASHFDASAAGQSFPLTCTADQQKTTVFDRCRQSSREHLNDCRKAPASPGFCHCQASTVTCCCQPSAEKNDCLDHANELNATAVYLSSTVCQLPKSEGKEKWARCQSDGFCFSFKPRKAGSVLQSNCLPPMWRGRGDGLLDEKRLAFSSPDYAKCLNFTYPKLGDGALCICMNSHREDPCNRKEQFLSDLLQVALSMPPEDDDSRQPSTATEARSDDDDDTLLIVIVVVGIVVVVLGVAIGIAVCLWCRLLCFAKSPDATTLDSTLASSSGTELAEDGVVSVVSTQLVPLTSDSTDLMTPPPPQLSKDVQTVPSQSPDAGTLPRLPLPALPRSQPPSSSCRTNPDDQYVETHFGTTQPPSMSQLQLTDNNTYENVDFCNYSKEP